MKICYLVHDMNPRAGWGRLANDLASGVMKAGNDIVVLKELDDGFRGLPILKRGGRLLFSAYRARKHLKDCDVVHALDVYPFGIIAYLGALFLRKKIVISLIGTYSVAPLYNKKTALLSRLAVRAVAVVTSISDFTRREVLRKVRSRDVLIVTPGIDLETFYKKRSSANENFIISVGVLKHRKGYHVSIPAFARAKKEMPSLKYKIIGSQKDSHYFSQLKLIATDYGVAEDVQFFENISDEELSRLYKEARLFMLTSVNADNHFEGFGIVFLEAAAAGLPVIGTMGNGIEDAIKDGHNGILVPQNDIAQTGKAIVDIVKDTKKWEDMSAHSYAWAKENTVDKMVERYLDIYNNLLK